MGKSKKTSQKRMEIGESSSRPHTRQSHLRQGREPIPSTAPVGDFDASRFTSKANQDWFLAKQNNGFIVEKTVQPHLEAIFHIHELFARLGWEVMLSFTGVYYRTLVCEFYANMEQKPLDGLWEITTHVRGKQIKVTERSLASLLGIPHVAVRWRELHGVVVHDETFSKDVAVTALNQQYRAVARGSAVLTTHLPICQRLFVYMIAANISPHASSSNELRLFDIYFLHKAIFGLWDVNVSLPSILIASMREVARTALATVNLRFPLLISRILEAAGVDLQVEQPLRTTVYQELGDASMTRMGYLLVNGIWRHPIHEPLQPGEVATNKRDRRQPPPPVEVDEEAEIANIERAEEEAAEPPPQRERRRSPIRELLTNIFNTCKRMEERQIADSIEFCRRLGKIEKALDIGSSTHEDEAHDDDTD